MSRTAGAKSGRMAAAKESDPVVAARRALLEGVGMEVAASFPGITRLGGQIVAALYLADVPNPRADRWTSCPRTGRSKSNIFANLRALEAAGVVERRRSAGARHDRFALRGPYPDVLVGAYVSRLRRMVADKRALVDRSLSLLGEARGEEADLLRSKLDELGRKYGRFGDFFQRVGPALDIPIDLELLLRDVLRRSSSHRRDGPHDVRQEIVGSADRRTSSRRGGCVHVRSSADSGLSGFGLFVLLRSRARTSPPPRPRPHLGDSLAGDRGAAATGSDLFVTLDTPIASYGTRTGQSVVATVDRRSMRPMGVLVTAGSTLRGHVVSVETAPKARVAIKFDSIQTVSAMVPISATVLDAGNFASPGEASRGQELRRAPARAHRPARVDGRWTATNSGAAPPPVYQLFVPADSKLPS